MIAKDPHILFAEDSKTDVDLEERELKKGPRFQVAASGDCGAAVPRRPSAALGARPAPGARRQRRGGLEPIRRAYRRGEGSALLWLTGVAWASSCAVPALRTP